MLCLVLSTTFLSIRPSLSIFIFHLINLNKRTETKRVTIYWPLQLVELVMSMYILILLDCWSQRLSKRKSYECSKLLGVDEY